MTTRLVVRNFLCILVMVLVHSNQVRAEVYGPPAEFGWKKSTPLHLLLLGEVTADLGLNEQQARELKDLQNEVQKEFEKALALARVSDDKKVRRYLPDELLGKNPEILHTIRNKHSEKINSLLTGEQQIRLHQIHLQYGTLASNSRLLGMGRTALNDGADILSDSTVAKELELSSSQRNEIKAIHKAITRAESGKVRLGTNYNGPNYHDLENGRSEAIMKVLTAQQIELLQKLKGKPLRIQQSSFLALP